MSSARDPARWLESSDDTLSPAQKSALAALAAHGPSSHSRERILEHVQAATTHTTTDPSWLRRGAWPLLASALLLGALLTWSATRSQPRSSAVSASPAAPPPSPPVPVREPPSPVLESAPRVAKQSVRRHTVASPPRAAAAKASTSATQPRDELLLLTPARQLLSVQPRRALALAEEHSARFTHGVFAEERDFIRIEALLRLHQRAAAETHAQTFQRAYPGSTYLVRLAELLAKEN